MNKERADGGKAMQTFEMELGGRKLVIEQGKMAILPAHR